MTRHIVTLDSIARTIAADAGVIWRELPDHPGFSKGRWRDLTRLLIRKFIPDATFIEGRRLWNGKLSEDLVDSLSDADLQRVVETGCRESAKALR